MQVAKYKYSNFIQNDSIEYKAVDRRRRRSSRLNSSADYKAGLTG